MNMCADVRVCVCVCVCCSRVAGVSFDVCAAHHESFDFFLYDHVRSMHINVCMCACVCESVFALQLSCRCVT